MKIVTPPLTVEINDAFKNDILDRKNFGDSLLNLITRSEDELVISLDGQWGEGKTTFIKMWQGALAEANIPNIYIDAFSNDYVDDAFISIASAITNFSEANINEENLDKFVELKEKTKKIGVQLLSWSAKMGIKAATMGIIKDADLEELKDIKGDIASGMSGIVGSFVEDRLKSHSEDIALIESFKKLLSEIPSKLKNNDDNPLVIIIDELDRCKPTFAVEILEKIKHLFSVKNIVFVLVMHKTQLEESIKSVYGLNIDAHTYLQKFISIETKIPKKSGNRYNNDLGKYSRTLLKLHEIETWGDDRILIDSAEPLVNHFNLSLRQLEKVFTNLSIIYGTSGKNHLRIVPIIVFLSVIKVIDPNLFEQLLYRKISYTELCNQLNLCDLDEESEKGRKLYWLMEWVKFGLLTQKEFKKLSEDDALQRFGKSLWQYDVERERIIPIFAEQLSMFVVN